MRSYETVVILDNKLEEAPLEEEITSIEGLIASNQGEVVDTERWGSRKLSYEINDVHQGFFTLIRFEGEPGLVDVLDRTFKLNDRVLRHMTKRVRKHPAHVYEKAAEAQRAAEAEKAVQAEQTEPAAQPEEEEKSDNDTGAKA